MADNLDEKVSALVDGELPHDEVDQLVMALKQDKDHQTSWRHYHLISDALKNNLPDKLPEDFVSRVSLALESEPHHVSPPHRVVKQPAFHRPTLGFALAASVAAAAFLGLGWNNLSEIGTNQGPAMVADVASNAVPGTVPSALVSAPVNGVPVVSYTKVHGKQWDVERPDVISKLNNYLLNHDQYSFAAGVRSGVLPQVRIVGYERVEGVPMDSMSTEGGR